MVFCLAVGKVRSAHGLLLSWGSGEVSSSSSA